MKTTKIFFMAALALMTVACSNDDNDIQTPAEQPTEQLADNMVTITAKLAPKSGSAQTRVLSDQTTYIKAEWAQNEQLKIISSNGYTATANIDAVDGSGTATISFTIDAAAVGKNCLIVYPASAAATTGALDYASNPALTSQDGTLNANLDVRVGNGTINADNPGTLTVTTQPAAQYSIFKFTTQDLNSTDKTATQFKVSDNSGNVITTVTPTSNEFYVALPVLATGMYWFNATIDSKPYIAKANISTATVAGRYYQTTVKMATVGDAILSDGKFATEGTSGQEAVIVYVGTVDKYFNHFLAIALEDAANNVTWSAAQTAIGTYAAAHPITIGGTTYNNTNACTSGYDVVSDNNATTSATATMLHQGWRMPTVTDWRYLYAGIFGKSPTTPIGVNKNMEYYNTSSSGIDKHAIQDLVSDDIFKGYSSTYTTWFSSEVTGSTGYAWNYQPDYCDIDYQEKTVNLNVVAVFAY